jgi:hypothetical protein
MKHKGHVRSHAGKDWLKLVAPSDLKNTTNAPCVSGSGRQRFIETSGITDMWVTLPVSHAGKALLKLVVFATMSDMSVPLFSYRLFTSKTNNISMPPKQSRSRHLWEVHDIGTGILHSCERNSRNEFLDIPTGIVRHICRRASTRPPLRICGLSWCSDYLHAKLGTAHGSNRSLRGLVGGGCSLKVRTRYIPSGVRSVSNR